MLLLKSILRELILPPSGPLLLAGFGLFLQRYRPLLGRSIVLGCIVALLLMSMPMISDHLTGFTEHYEPLDISHPVDAQAIVVLGGGGQTVYAPEYGGPATKTIMLEKAAYAAYVARRTGLPILFTGTRIEALSMRETLSRNFDTPVRWNEDQARDTFENAANSAKLLLPEGIRKVILITRSTHMWRSAHEFEAVGFQVVPAPVEMLLRRPHRGIQDYVPQASALLDSSLAIYELIGEPMRRLMEALHIRHHSPFPT